ncbi:hypothetical protein [Cognatilysobacter lacus]|uniref:Uncharacterized protein n=1 Tax=Cognatilysobacter lacus TaxID=1643323 RepID=A0A5D8ZDC8_9GAMM|nr:hypothetical protein [Lysobacter lacus]TZF90644.1 hypothetical protein FW784_04545 [Lysobacter lacus]
MKAITTSTERAKPAATRDAPERRVRVSDELYEFRRYNYAEGWDSDDVALGWVDESIVELGSRRLH